MSKKCRPQFKKHESNKSRSLVILRKIDERNRTSPPQSRQFIAQAARLSSRAAFVLNYSKTTTKKPPGGTAWQRHGGLQLRLFSRDAAEVYAQAREMTCPTERN
jgi:hypothetical protein